MAWSLHHFDGVYVACAAVCLLPWGGAVALLCGAGELSWAGRDLRHPNTEKTKFSFKQPHSQSRDAHGPIHTCVTGWWRSTMTELMGGATPITCTLLRGALATSARAEMRAVTVFEGFCWIAVTTRPLAWKTDRQRIFFYQTWLILYFWSTCRKSLVGGAALHSIIIQ